MLSLTQTDSKQLREEKKNKLTQNIDVVYLVMVLLRSFGIYCFFTIALWLEYEMQCYECISKNAV